MDKWTSGAAYDQWMGRWSRLVADEFLNWLNFALEFALARRVLRKWCTD